MLLADWLWCIQINCLTFGWLLLKHYIGEFPKGVKIKPDLSPQERLCESLLLKECWKLIQAGTDQKHIKIWKSSLIVSGRAHSEVINNAIHYASAPIAASSVVMDVENQGDNCAERSTLQPSKTTAWLNCNLKYKFFYVNARSICNKLKELQAYVYASSTDIITITETWLSPDYWDNEILPTCYTIYRRDRNSCGRGVLLAVRNGIPSKLLNTPSDIEGVTVEINHTNPTNVSVIYAAPQSSISYFDSCCKHLSNLTNTCLPTIVVGDFNLPDINWETLSGSSIISNQFCEHIFNLN